jgi:hypothetical protein
MRKPELEVVEYYEDHAMKWRCSACGQLFEGVGIFISPAAKVRLEFEAHLQEKHASDDLEPDLGRSA